MEIPDSHPRKLSLESRQKIVDGAMSGLLADSAMIAHGRGEAFDYLQVRGPLSLLQGLLLRPLQGYHLRLTR